MSPNIISKENPDLVEKAESTLEGAVNHGSELMPELSIEQQIDNVDNQVATETQKIKKFTNSIESTRNQITEAREDLFKTAGIPVPSAPKEEAPSVLSYEDELEKSKKNLDSLNKQKEELITQKEREDLIKAEKERILQEKLGHLFDEFKNLNESDTESVLKGEKNFDSKSFGPLEKDISQPLAKICCEGAKLVPKEKMGDILNTFINLDKSSLEALLNGDSDFENKLSSSIDKSTAQSLVKIFNNGEKLLPKILEKLPELLKKLDEEVEKEATETVDKMIDEAKKKSDEKENDDGENLGEKSTEQKPEEPKLTEESMVLKNQATPEKLKTETVPNNSVSENI